MMTQLVPQSVVYVVTIIAQLKWAWDYLLHQSFIHPSSGIYSPLYVDDLSVLNYEGDPDSRESVECVVCLCKIEEGEEIRELSCRHLFHRCCLDRWLWYSHMTCPLCRNNLKFPPLVAELHQEIILVNFFSTGYRDRCTWWLC